MFDKTESLIIIGLAATGSLLTTQIELDELESKNKINGNLSVWLPVLFTKNTIVNTISAGVIISVGLTVMKAFNKLC